MGARALIIIFAAAAAASGATAALGDAPRGERRPPWKRLDEPSIAACGGCHVETTGEWAKSLHARAWTNENVQVATAKFTMAGCRACHSPLPISETGLRARPAYRDYNQTDGVHCLSCHGLENGVAAARTIESAPCRPTRDPGLLTADACYPCHQPTHQAFDEYEVSAAKREGKRCVDCHMPARADGGRSHGPHGGMNAAFVAKGVDVRWSESAGEIEWTATNRTGHKFPGEVPSRSFIIRIETDGDVRYETIRKPNKGEDRADNRLTPDETRRWSVPLGARSTDIRLLFKPLPLLPDDESFELARWSR